MKPTHIDYSLTRHGRSMTEHVHRHGFLKCKAYGFFTARSRPRAYLRHAPHFVPRTRPQGASLYNDVRHDSQAITLNATYGSCFHSLEVLAAIGVRFPALFPLRRSVFIRTRPKPTVVKALEVHHVPRTCHHTPLAYHRRVHIRAPNRLNSFWRWSRPQWLLQTSLVHCESHTTSM